MPIRFFMALAIIFMVRGAYAVQTGALSPGYDSHGKRNPFVPPSPVGQGSAGGEEDVDTSAFEAWFSQNLGGIVWDEASPYALIKDDIVPVGGEVRGCTIVEIKRDGIVFRYGKKRVEVPFKERAKEEEKQGER